MSRPDEIKMLLRTRGLFYARRYTIAGARRTLLDERKDAAPQVELGFDEAERRREKQLEHNRLHGITPIGISKQIKDMIEGVYDAQQVQLELKAAQDQARYETMSEKQLAREIKQLEKQMLEHARNLEFEKAAAIRDRNKQLRTRELGLSGSRR